jgi:hypothetical protein
MQRPEDPGVSLITKCGTINEPVVPLGPFVWVNAFSKIGREAPVRTEPLPTLTSERINFFRRAPAEAG